MDEGFVTDTQLLREEVESLREKTATLERAVAILMKPPDPCNVVPDLERLFAFFGDAEWSMPNDERWGGEVFRGDEVVERIRNALDRTHNALIGACETAIKFHDDLDRLRAEVESKS